MKKIINKVFILLIISLNMAYLPQAIIAIINKIPLVSSITYSHEYISAGLRNNFPLIRYSKDIFILMLFILMIFDAIKKRKISKKVLTIIIVIVFIVTPLSIFSLMISDEFNIYMIIAGIRIVIFPITIIMFVLQYLEYKNIETIYKVLMIILKIIFMVTLFQAFIIITKLHTFNIVKYRLIGTFAASGLLGLFGVGIIIFIILYKLRINSSINIKLNSILVAFIIYASGTRTSMVIYCIILFSYIYSRNINKRNNYKLTSLFIILLFFVGIIVLNISEVLADRGDAISAQFNNGRVTFILEYLKECNLKEILFGKGIGFGTNTALSMLKETFIDSTTKVMDGTINILITQFGIIITSFVVFSYLYIIRKIIKTNLPSEVKIAIIAATVLLIVIGNVFEQFSLQLLLIINYYLILKKFKDEKDD